MAPEKTVTATDLAAAIETARQLLNVAKTALAANPNAQFKVSDSDADTVAVAVGKKCPPCS